jgi:hypothetical protein
MELQEGEVYEGRISLTGGEGPLHRWLVIAPFGKTHIHSIDDPLDTHCWPASALINGLKEHRARRVDYQPNHPMLRLQRAKEAWDVRDTALGLSGERLHKMLALMKQALVEDRDVALYAAGEIITLLQRTPLSSEHSKAVERHIGRVLHRYGKSFAALVQQNQLPA